MTTSQSSGSSDDDAVDTTLVVLAGRTGDPVPASAFEPPTADRVLAVDSGLHLATRLGLAVDVVIGDLDSVDQDLLSRALRRGVETEVHPRDKDHTDLALALAHAARLGSRRIVVVGGAGGRLDHGLANLHALADPSLADIEVVAHFGGADVTVVRQVTRPLDGPVGGLVSLIAVDGPARGVTTQGLRWDLADAVLDPTSTRGVSNELLTPPAHVTVADGVLLAIQPAHDEHLEA